jgi:hypothetical protein
MREDAVVVDDGFPVVDALETGPGLERRGMLGLPTRDGMPADDVGAAGVVPTPGIVFFR